MMEDLKPIETLLDEWSFGSLSESEINQLRERLRTDPESRQKYVQWQMLNAAMKLESSAGGIMTAAGVTQTPRNSSINWNRLLAVAASIALGVIAVRWAYLEWNGQQVASINKNTSVEQNGISPDSAANSVGRTEATSQGIALVTRLVDAKWSSSGQAAEVGEALSPGRLNLESGYAQIEFFCGASVVLEGPAELELVSSTAARFLSGRLRAQVPPAARGFQIDVDGMSVVDLGTEFGVSISPDGADVQVFDGEVELHRPRSEKQLVTAGQAFLHEGGDLRQSKMTPDRFVDLAALDSQAQGQITQRYQRWRAYSDRLKKDDRLIAYYAPTGVDRWKRKFSNQTLSADGKRNSEFDGAIVGASRVAGRWPNKGALEFKQPGDRVRVNIPGEFRSLTFACWVKIDSLDRWYNSLFLTDNYQEGEPHWQILDSGQLFFSVRPGAEAKGIGHKTVVSEPFWNPSMSGKWLHIATTYDVDAKQTTHYLNGKQLHQESIPEMQLVNTTRIGMASIGNWSVPTKPEEHFAIRNLNGSLDEFAIFATALSATEILQMYDNGKP